MSGKCLPSEMNSYEFPSAVLLILAGRAVTLKGPVTSEVSAADLNGPLCWLLGETELSLPEQSLTMI